MVKIKKAGFLATLLVGTAISSLLVISCNNNGNNPKEARIPLPVDTSALGKIDHFISMDQMDEFKKDFMIQKDSLSYKQPDLFVPASEAFNKNALLEILKNPECVGIRIYYGVKKGDKRNEFRLMLVGVNGESKDLYISKSAAGGVGKINGGNMGGLEFGQCNPPCK